MPAPVPTSEPAVVTAGETLAWTRALPDYPASLWTLKYSLQRGTDLLVITATASGDTFAIAVPPATSATYIPGVWNLTAYVEQGSGAGLVRHMVSVGELRILPCPLAALGESQAAQMLRLIDLALVGRIPRGLETTNIDGQELVRISIPALERLRDRYAAKVQLELAAARAAAGLKVRRTIGIAFRKP